LFVSRLASNKNWKEKYFPMSRSRRALWTAKVLGQLPGRPASDDDETLAAAYQRRAYQGVVLGIDPSLRGTGLAVVEFTPEGARLLYSRTVKLKARVPFAACLGEIFRAAEEALTKARVRHVAIEETIFVQNRRAVHILGAARGAAIAAAAMAGVEVFEYAPLRIKQAVVGFGRASKEQVAGMVARHVNLQTTLPADESDAAATALCHAFTWRG
jgi:crossover junction endodeoxyribonuclease RuvC